VFVGVIEGVAVEVGVTLGDSPVVEVFVGVIVIVGVLVAVTLGVTEGVAPTSETVLDSGEGEHVSLFISVTLVAEKGMSIGTPATKSTVSTSDITRFVVS